MTCFDVRLKFVDSIQFTIKYDLVFNFILFTINMTCFDIRLEICRFLKFTIKYDFFLNFDFVYD